MSGASAGRAWRAPGRLLPALAVLVPAALLPGCLYQRYTTQTARSATEQLLVSYAVERAAASLAWPQLDGRAVTVETVALNEGDASFVGSVIEARARAQGARVVSPDEAEMVLVVFASAVGTVFRSLGFGIPPLAFPGGIGTPGIPFVQFLKHRGYARLQLVGHDRSGVHLFETPPVLGRASFEIYGFLFLAVRRNDIYPGEGFQLSVD